MKKYRLHLVEIAIFIIFAFLDTVLLVNTIKELSMGNRNTLNIILTVASSLVLLGLFVVIFVLLIKIVGERND